MQKPPKKVYTRDRSNSFSRKKTTPLKLARAGEKFHFPLNPLFHLAHRTLVDPFHHSSFEGPQ